MTQFKEYELGSVCQRLSSGKNIKAAKVFDFAQYPVYGGNGLRGYTEEKNFEGECAIIGRQGAYCGNVRYFSGEAYMTEHAVVVQANECNNTRYLSYLLSTMNLGRLSGQSAQPGLSVAVLGKQIINLPEKNVQDKIVSFLGLLDEKITNNEMINRNLAEQIQLLYTIYFENEESREWKTVSLSEMIFFQEGPGIRNWQYVEEEGTKFINIRCINNGDIDVSTANMISNKEANGKYAHFMLKPYDIVMSCSGTLGRYAIVREEHLPLCLNTSVIRFSPAVTDSDFSYVYGYMTSKEFLNRQKEMACGSVQANFGPTHLNKMEIHEPPLELRKEYHNNIFPLIQQMICLRRENDILTKTRDSLLPRLMSGELDVSGAGALVR